MAVNPLMLLGVMDTPLESSKSILCLPSPITNIAAYSQKEEQFSVLINKSA